jgi:hypothetical protein
MEGVLINDKGTNASGTHLQDFINISYAELVEKLGEPGLGSDKDQVEWVLQKGEVVATIYDYSVFDGLTGTPVRSIMHWHIGGFDKRAVELVREVLGISN